MHRTFQSLRPHCPRGGGAITSMGESLGAVGPTGQVNMTLPLPITAGRNLDPDPRTELQQRSRQRRLWPGLVLRRCADLSAHQRPVCRTILQSAASTRRTLFWVPMAMYWSPSATHPVTWFG